MLKSIDGYCHRIYEILQPLLDIFILQNCDIVKLPRRIIAISFIYITIDSLFRAKSFLTLFSTERFRSDIL